MDAKAIPQNIQDAFLNTARRERSTVIIFLLHGAKLTGRIRGFDKFSVLIETGQQEQLVFKHAISTISHTRRGTGELRYQHPTTDQPGEVATSSADDDESSIS